MYRCAFKSGKYTVPMHIHQCSEIIIVLDGEITATVGGEERVLRRGDAAVISPFAEHRLFTQSGVRFWLCVFSSSLTAQTFSPDEIYSARNSAFFKISDGLYSFIEDRLPDSDEEMVPFGYEEQRRMLVILLSIFEEYFARTHVISVAKNKRSLLSEILTYLDTHYSEPLTIHTVSKALGYTPRHISRQLAPLNDYNFRTLVNLFRVERAKIKLRQSNAKILDVSRECGFVSGRSFFRSFIKSEGITPNEYRKIVKKLGRHYREVKPHTPED